MSNYIFDVDGTLTPSRGVMDPYFKAWFLGFASSNNVVLVTGSDKLKTIEQVGEEVYNKCKRVYNCSGNDVYEGDKQVSHNDWELPKDTEEFLNEKLESTFWATKTGLHIEHRTGKVNFSIVGRNANTTQRKNYFKYDQIVEERINIAKEFNETFPELSAKVGGETGIDIFQKGGDKSQILNDFAFELDTIRFYGDRVDPAGNDYPIAILLQPHQVNAVSDWKHTWALLK